LVVGFKLIGIFKFQIIEKIDIENGKISNFDRSLNKIFLFSSLYFTVGKKALFLFKNLELLNRSPDVGGFCG
jgi:hypothetical protein